MYSREKTFVSPSTHVSCTGLNFINLNTYNLCVAIRFNQSRVASPFKSFKLNWKNRLTVLRKSITSLKKSCIARRNTGRTFILWIDKKLLLSFCRIAVFLPTNLFIASIFGSDRWRWYCGLPSFDLNLIIFFQLPLSKLRRSWSRGSWLINTW